MSKIFVFRFDIDTHKCIREGVPNLLRLAEKHKIKFTFFLNTGKSINFKSNILKLLFKPRINELRPEKILCLPSIKKLGKLDYLIAALINPNLYLYREQIKMIQAQGHELGLHGGKNHDDWHKSADTWSNQEILNQIDWGIQNIQNIVPDFEPFGFSSPGWTSSPTIWQALSKRGFRYAADQHTDQPIQKIDNFGSLKIVPTNILGEPGGVAYIEYCRAKKMNNSQIVNDFLHKLHEREKLAIFYDHPFYSGCEELDLLDKLITKVLENGYRIATIQEVVTS